MKSCTTVWTHAGDAGDGVKVGSDRVLRETIDHEIGEDPEGIGCPEGGDGTEERDARLA